MNKRYILPLLLAIDGIILLIEASFLSISYGEAHTFFNYNGIVGYLSHLFIPLFGQNDIALRLPMILLHLVSVSLLYQISKRYLKEDRHRIILILVYMMLPGVNSAALLVHISGFIIFALFFFVYLFQRYGESIAIYFLLLLYTFFGHSFFYLLFALFLYGVYYKRYVLTLYTSVLMGVNYYIFGTDIGGYPTGHFLDALAVYSAIFSPIIFVYLVYVLYRRFLMQQRDLIWFLASTALIFSLLLSLRQRVHLEIYAPYLILALPLVAQTFVFSYHVRLPRFRKGYKLLFNAAFIFLIINFIFILANRYLYIWLDNPKKHFAYKNNIAKELSLKLKKMNIECLTTQHRMQLRLKFYSISECREYILTPFAEKNSSQSVTVSYFSKPVYSAYVTKVNNK